MEWKVFALETHNCFTVNQDIDVKCSQKCTDHDTLRCSFLANSQVWLTPFNIVGRFLVKVYLPNTSFGRLHLANIFRLNIESSDIVEFIYICQCIWGPDPSHKIIQSSGTQVYRGSVEYKALVRETHTIPNHANVLNQLGFKSNTPAPAATRH